MIDDSDKELTNNILLFYLFIFSFKLNATLEMDAQREVKK